MKTKAIMFCSICTIVFLLFLGTSSASAAIPYTINYQGFLTDSVGASVNGTVSITFALYTTSTGGTALWTESQNVAVSGGIYSVILGSVSPLNPLAFDVPYWLGVRVGSDAEMTPRVQLTSVGYAFTSDMAMDLVCNGCVNLTDIGANGCTANQILKWSGTAWTCSNMSSIAETDPKVGTLTTGSWCTTNGTVINCTAAVPVAAELDPQVGLVTTADNWCRASGSAVECDRTSVQLAAAHNHDAAYVNGTGDAMTGTLNIAAIAGNGLNVTSFGPDDAWDAIYDISLGGTWGEIFGTQLNLVSNSSVIVQLDNDNNASDAFWVYDGANNPVFGVGENGDAVVTGNLGVLGIIAGELQISNGGARPACNSTLRGRIWLEYGAPAVPGPGSADTFAICTKNADDSYTWKDLY
jgi:hypothetical protein